MAFDAVNQWIISFAVIRIFHGIGIFLIFGLTRVGNEASFVLKYRILIKLKYPWGLSAGDHDK
jgi:hypothetical protein